jgi:hypothetical protein
MHPPSGNFTVTKTKLSEYKTVYSEILLSFNMKESQQSCRDSSEQEAATSPTSWPDSG